MDIFLSILLIASFVGALIYMMKGGSTLLSFIGLAIVWSVISRVPFNSMLTEVIQQPVEKYAPTIMVLIFGSWFGQILIKTGVVNSLVKRAMELGGDKPILVTIIAVLVVAFLFTSLNGVGAAIAIGVVILPILLSMGVPPALVSASFTMSIASTMIINVIQFNVYAPLFPKGTVVYDNHFLVFGMINAAIWIVLTIIMVVFNLKKRGVQHNWAVAAAKEEEKAQEVHPIAYIAPIIPVVTIAVLKWPAIPSFIAAIAYVLIVTKGGHSKSWVELLHRSLNEAVTTMGPIIAIWIAIVMFMAAGTKATPILKPLFGSILPQSPIVLAIVVAVLAPLGLYRGLMAPMGAGAALLALLLNSNAIAPLVIFVVFVCAVNNMLGCMDPTNSWNLWTYTNCKVSPKEHLKTGLPFVWVGTAITAFLAVIMFA